MTYRTGHSVAVLMCAVALVLASAVPAFAQRRPPNLREFLSQFRGREVLIMDKTGGAEQFATGEAAKAYTVILNEILNDYFVVTRDAESDKRSFVYPMSVIRRIIFAYDNKPYQKIVIEMY
jgi:hypothetical protein